MESVGAVLIVLAIILLIIDLIWWIIAKPATMPTGMAIILGFALFFLVLGTVVGSWSLMMRGVVFNEQKLPGIAGLHTSLTEAI